MSYQQCTRFRTTLDFDHEYLWNRSSNRQAKNGVIIYNFFHVRRKQLGKLRSTNEKMTLTFDLWPWYSIGFVWLSRNTFMENIIKLSAAVHELLCAQTFVPYLAMVKNPKIHVLWPWPLTLIFSGFQAVVKIHVAAKFHRAQCSGSLSYRANREKLWRKQYSPSLTHEQ